MKPILLPILITSFAAALTACGTAKPKLASDSQSPTTSERPEASDACVLGNLNICNGSGAPEDFPAQPTLEALVLTPTEISIPVKILEVLPLAIVGENSMKEFGGIVYFPEDSSRQFDSNYVLSNRNQKCEQNCWVLDPYNENFQTAKAEQIRSGSACSSADSIQVCTQRYFERLDRAQVYIIKGIVKHVIGDGTNEDGQVVQRRYKVFEIRDVTRN